MKNINLSQSFIDYSTLSGLPRSSKFSLNQKKIFEKKKLKKKKIKNIWKQLKRLEV